MGGVALVCDSTSDLGLDWFEQNNVVMVPLKVQFGEDSFRDWTELAPKEFFEKLDGSKVLPTTSQPTPADFASAYSALVEQGFDEIVSVHLSSPLSGTFESATMAAADCAIPVRVVDTLTITSATGLAVSAAAEARDAGGNADAIESAARRAAKEGTLFFILDTLEYLVKGGRAGKASGLAAAVLNIKPVLTVNHEGIIEPYKKVKGLKKAMTEVAAQAAEDSKSGPLKLSILYSVSKDLPEQMIALLDAAGVDYDLQGVYEVGAVIGTYAGPNAIGCAYYPKA